MSAAPALIAVSSWFEDCRPAPEEWLIDRLVPAAAYVGIFGRRGSAKSFLALEIACCGALGRPFLGQEVERFGSIYCVGEKKARFGKRVEAWRRSRGAGNLPVCFRWSVPNLLDDREVDGFIEELIESKADFQRRGAPLRAVFLDTLSRALRGANVSDAEAAGIALGSITRIIDQTGLTIIPIAHVAKAEGSSTQKGAGEWEDAADTLIRIDRPDAASPYRSVTLTKQSDDADGSAFAFELEVVEVGVNSKGSPVTSCVIREVDCRGPREAKRITGGALIAKDALAYLIDNHITVEPPANVFHAAGLRWGQQVVEVKAWKNRAGQMGLWDEDDTPGNRRQKWHGATLKLRDARLVLIEGSHAIPLGVLAGVRP